MVTRKLGAETCEPSFAGSIKNNSPGPEEIKIIVQAIKTKSVTKSLIKESLSLTSL